MPSNAHGVLWQWTSSPYGLSGFRPASGAIEYNGKFMSSQMVLQGNWLTPEDAHNTYRNFFPPAQRWMASGLRLAR